MFFSLFCLFLCLAAVLFQSHEEHQCRATAELDLVCLGAGVSMVGVRCATWARAAVGLWQMVVQGNECGRCRNAAQGVFLGATYLRARCGIAAHSMQVIKAAPTDSLSA